jgi:hypothetical protein
MLQRSGSINSTITVGDDAGQEGDGLPGLGPAGVAVALVVGHVGDQLRQLGAAALAVVGCVADRGGGHVAAPFLFRLELLQLLLGSGGQQVRMCVQDLREELPRKIEAAAAPEGGRESRGSEEVGRTNLPYGCSESDPITQTEFMVSKRSLLGLFSWAGSANR